MVNGPLSELALDDALDGALLGTDELADEGVMGREMPGRSPEEDGAEI